MLPPPVSIKSNQSIIISRFFLGNLQTKTKQRILSNPPSTPICICLEKDIIISLTEAGRCVWMSELISGWVRRCEYIGTYIYMTWSAMHVPKCTCHMHVPIARTAIHLMTRLMITLLWATGNLSLYAVTRYSMTKRCVLQGSAWGPFI